MAIIINFAGASLLKPGAYSNTTVAEGVVSSPALGVVALIGEAEEGAAFADESGLSAVTFGPDEFSAIRDKYGSGELVDAARLAISPSNDPQIKGGAQELLLLKTNASTSASLALATDYGTLTARRPGLPGNNTSVAIATQGDQVIITLSRLDLGVTEISEPLGDNSVISVQCTDGGASAVTLTLTATALTTAVTGGTAANLNVPLSSFNSIAQLATYLNSQDQYTASVVNASLANKPVSSLDRVTALDIKASAQELKRDLQDVKDFFASSALVTFAATATGGLPDAASRTFFAGGAKGATAQSDIQDALDNLLKRRINFIVPLFSRDAADDIADGLTDADSDYSIDSVHAALNSHCNQASTVKGRKERQGFAAFKGSYADTQSKSAALNAARVSLALQDVDVLTAASGVQQKQPHMLQVLNAGMKASAALGLPNTFKSPLISGYTHEDFDPETQADKAIADNLVFVEQAPNGGFRFVLDNSTYASDLDAWIYNRPAVLYAADFAALAIRLNTETFVGQRNSDISEETIKNLLVGVMDSLKSAGVIVADNNTQGRGYKDLKVKITGSIVTIDVTLALVEGVEFVLSNIKVQRAA